MSDVQPDDDATVIKPQENPGDPGVPPAAEKPAEMVDAMSEIDKRGQLKGKDDIKGRIRVLSRKDLEEIIAGLLKKYGSLSNQDLIAQLGALEMQAGQDKAKHERELDALRAEANAALEAQRLQYETELQRIREVAIAEARERILELERLLENERMRTGDLEAKLAAALAEIERLSKELATAQGLLNDSDKRSKMELLKLIEQLKARIAELEMALDYYDLEEEFDFDAFVRHAEGLSKKLEGSAAAGALEVFSRAKEIQSNGQSSHQKFQLLLAKMYDAKGTVGVVVDLAKLIKQCEAAAARAKDVDAVFAAGK